MPVTSISASGGVTCSTVTSGSFLSQTCHGTTTCTILGGGNQCLTTGVMFSTPFQTAPTVGRTGPNIGVSTNILYSSFCFLCASSTGIPWTNMPATMTEIFGDTNAQHEIPLEDASFFNVVQLYGSADFLLTVSCTVASNTLGAFLQTQYSLDNGVSWHDLANTPGDGNVLIDNTHCPTSSGFLNSVTAAMATSLRTVSCPQGGDGYYSPCITFRIVGSGGGGVGDTPTFSMIQLTLLGTAPVPLISNFGSVTTTSMTVTCSVSAGIRIANPSGIPCSVSWLASS